MIWRIIAALLATTAALHALAPVIHEWNADTRPLVSVSLVFAILAWSVWQGQPLIRRWGWVLPLIGMIAAYIILETADIPERLTWLYIGFDAVIVVLWRTAIHQEKT